MPCSSVIFPGLYRLKQECPHRLARANILAGLAWAVALVNIRDPDVIAAFIRRNVSGPLEREAFADGMQSAATIWRDWSPYSPLLQSLCDYRPANGSQETRLLWDQTGRGHCSEEFEAAYHRLKQRGSMDELFQFRANDAGSD
jgi:hypothetical protein